MHKSCKKYVYRQVFLVTHINTQTFTHEHTLTHKRTHAITPNFSAVSPSSAWQFSRESALIVRLKEVIHLIRGLITVLYVKQNLLDIISLGGPLCLRFKKTKGTRWKTWQSHSKGSRHHNHPEPSPAEDGKMRSVFVTRWVHMACWLVCEWPSSISALMVGLIGKGAEWCGTARGHIKLLIVIYHPPRLLVSSHSCLPEARQSERKGFGLERCVGVPRYTGGWNALIHVVSGDVNSPQHCLSVLFLSMNLALSIPLSLSLSLSLLFILWRILSFSFSFSLFPLSLSVSSHLISSHLNFSCSSTHHWHAEGKKLSLASTIQYVISTPAIQISEHDSNTPPSVHHPTFPVTPGPSSLSLSFISPSSMSQKGEKKVAVKGGGDSRPSSAAGR